MTHEQDKDVFLEIMKQFRAPSTHLKSQSHYNIPEATLPYHQCPLQADDIINIPGSIQKKLFQKLKTGQLTLEDSLDLHTLTRNESIQALQDFLYTSYFNEIKHLLVIHGKGHHSEHGSWLKNDVYAFLKTHPLVIAAHSAAPKDGGTGSVYIILKSFKKHGEINE